MRASSKPTTVVVMDCIQCGHQWSFRTPKTLSKCPRCNKAKGTVLGKMCIRKDTKGFWVLAEV